jgi:hypothetical protein
MTDLSPAAEAVLHAVTLKQYDVPYYACPASIDQIKSDAAAALRAAANQLRADPLDLLGGIHASQCQLLAIADELEQS